MRKQPISSNSPTERRHGSCLDLSRRDLLKMGTAGLIGGLAGEGVALPAPSLPMGPGDQDGSRIYHARNGSPAQNVAKVFELAYGGIQNFIGKDDVVLLRPNLQWPRNGYTNTEIGKALIDLILNREGGFTGEIIVIEDQQRGDPHTNSNSGWITANKLSNGPYNWFELIQYYADNKAHYPNGIHVDPTTGQINVSFQFLQGDYDFSLANPHPILSSYGGKRYIGANELLNGTIDPFRRFKSAHPTATCFYVRRSDLQYTNSIARVSPLQTQYYMSYAIFKSQHSGLYVSYFKEHPTAWDPATETFGSQRVRLINMCTLNHHGSYAGVTSVVKGHFGMAYGTFHNTGWEYSSPPTFYYAGGAIGYWMEKIRRADLHMSCAERIGLASRQENDAFRARAVAISTDPVALDYYVGKNVLFPAGGMYGEGGGRAGATDSHDPALPGGYYAMTLEFCRDPLADHSIVNGTLNEAEMTVRSWDFTGVPGDLNHDGHTDQEDVERMDACGSGPAIQSDDPACAAADLDGDGDVDQVDFGLLQSCLGATGPAGPSGCTLGPGAPAG